MVHVSNHSFVCLIVFAADGTWQEYPVVAWDFGVSGQSTPKSIVDLRGKKWAYQYHMSNSEFSWVYGDTSYDSIATVRAALGFDSPLLDR